MSEHKLKAHKNYIFYRWYAVLAVLAWNVVCLQSLLGSYPKKYIWIALPFVLPAFFMVSTLLMFPLKYGVFGPYKRTPFPNESPVMEETTWRGRISWYGSGITTWIVFPSGLGIKMQCSPFQAFGVRVVFIPVDRMVRLRSSGFWGDYVLDHNSPEVRSPIGIPSRHVFMALQTMMGRHRGDVE